MKKSIFQLLLFSILSLTSCFGQTTPPWQNVMKAGSTATLTAAVDLTTTSTITLSSTGVTTVSSPSVAVTGTALSFPNLTNVGAGRLLTGSSVGLTTWTRDLTYGTGTNSSLALTNTVTTGQSYYLGSNNSGTLSGWGILGSAIPGNYGGSNIPAAGLTYFSAGGLGENPMAIATSTLAIISSTTGSNKGARFDINGLRIGLNNTLATANTVAFQVTGSSGATLKIVDGNQASGRVLTSDVNGVASWAAAPSPALTATEIGFGGGANTLSSSPSLRYTNSTAKAISILNTTTDSYSALGFANGTNNGQITLFGDAYMGDIFGTNIPAASAFGIQNGLSTRYALCFSGLPISMNVGSLTTDRHVRIDNTGMRIATNATANTTSSGAIEVNGNSRFYSDDATKNLAVTNTGTDITGVASVSNTNATLATGGTGTATLNLYCTTAGAANIGVGMVFNPLVQTAFGGAPYGVAAVYGRTNTYSLGVKSGYLQFATSDDAGTLTERMRIRSNGVVNFSGIPAYADNAAALVGGLVAGDLYYTDTAGEYIVKITH